MSFCSLATDTGGEMSNQKLQGPLTAFPSPGSVAGADTTAIPSALPQPRLLILFKVRSVYRQACTPLVLKIPFSDSQKLRTPGEVAPAIQSGHIACSAVHFRHCKSRDWTDTAEVNTFIKCGGASMHHVHVGILGSVLRIIKSVATGN